MLLSQCLAVGLAPAEPEVSQATALAQFRRLVEENQCEGPVGEALERVQFAGFLVPSWLLLSGAHEHLQRIKSAWSAGQLKTPDGLRVETIGK